MNTAFFGLIDSFIPLRVLCCKMALSTYSFDTANSPAFSLTFRRRTLQDSPNFRDFSSASLNSSIFTSGFSFLNCSGSKRILEFGSGFFYWNEVIDSCSSVRMIHLLYYYGAALSSDIILVHCSFLYLASSYSTRSATFSSSSSGWFASWCSWAVKRPGQ